MKIKNVIAQLENLKTDLNRIKNVYIIKPGQEVIPVSTKNLVDELKKLDQNQDASIELSSIQNGKETVIGVDKITSLPQGVEINIVLS